jgi:hypothetical protein
MSQTVEMGWGWWEGVEGEGVGDESVVGSKLLKGGGRGCWGVGEGRYKR